MVEGQEIHSIIESIFGEVKGLNFSSQIQVNCPMCQQKDGLAMPDGKFNLEISTAQNRKVFRCWKCDEPKFSGSLSKLVKLYGTDSDYQLFKALYGAYYEYNEDEEEILPPIELPSEMIFFTDMDVDNEDHVEAYMYLVLDRKISREDILKYRLGFCTVGKYSKKIVIPSYDVNGEVSYFVTRTYDSKERTKYDNPKHDKSSIIFNEGLINWDSVVFLVEGVFDMIRLPNSIPLLGKDVSTLLFKKLKKHKPKIIVALDPDAWKGEMDLYDMLRLIYDNDTDNIRIMNLSGRDDIDEITKKFGQEELIKRLYTARKLNDDDYFGRKMTGIKHNGRWYYGDRK